MTKDKFECAEAVRASIMASAQEAGLDLETAKSVAEIGAKCWLLGYETRRLESEIENVGTVAPSERQG